MMHEVTNEHNHMPQRRHSMLRAVWPSAGRPAAEHFMHVNARRLLAPALAPPRVAPRLAACAAPRGLLPLLLARPAGRSLER